MVSGNYILTLQYYQLSRLRKKYHQKWRQHRAITVDTVDTVETVDTVDTDVTVETGDTVYTVGMTYNE